jgi:hypothetical protein
VIRSSILVTPGAAQAARSASCRSAHDFTVPRRITSLPLASTVMRLASSSALRRKVLLVISSGLDTFSKATYQDTLRAAGPSRMPIYAIDLGPVIRSRAFPSSNTVLTHASIGTEPSPDSSELLKHRVAECMLYRPRWILPESMTS